jgi:hypothetical protein
MHDGPTPAMNALVEFALGVEAASLPPAVIVTGGGCRGGAADAPPDS